METLPKEIMEIILNMTTSGGINGIYNIPALMLTNKALHEITKYIYIRVLKYAPIVKQLIQNSLLEYYIVLESKLGIDFAINLGLCVNHTHIGVCLGIRLDNILYYIIDTYGLPTINSVIYAEELLKRDDVTLIDKFVAHGFRVHELSIAESYKYMSIDTLRHVVKIPRINAFPVDYNYIHSSKIKKEILGILSDNEEAELAEKYRILHDHGAILKRDRLAEIMYELYSDTNYKNVRDFPILSQLVVDLYADAIHITSILQENPLRPKITKIFANALNLVINYDHTYWKIS